MSRAMWMPEVDNRLPEIELNIEALVATCAAREHTTVERVMGRGRHAEVVRARVAVWRVLRAHGWSLTRIGRFFGRDHSTIQQRS